MRHQVVPMVVLGGILDLVLPQRCVQCRAAGAWLCRECERKLRTVASPRCEHCGAPQGPAAHGCPECRGRSLWFASASAAFVYEGPARALVTACKFRAFRSLAGEMALRGGPAFAAACARLIPSAGLADDGMPYVTWVPGHRDHTLERGFNQAELLARGLARQAGLPSGPLLRRVRHGARQSGLARAARAANVSQSFVLREDAERVVSMFKRVMIVDDVYTTGETLSHCARVLIKADLQPHVFTFARTVRAVPSQTSLDDAVRKERCR